MFDEFIAYYHENVVSAFVEYREWSRNGIAGRSRDLRGALAAASALFHLREHLPKVAAITRAAAEQRCADYALLGDVVNAAKHKSVSRPTPHGPPLVTDAQQITEQLYVIKYEDEEGEYRYAQKNVLVRLADGTERNLMDVVINVLNFWEQHLFAHALLPSARQFTNDSTIRFRSRSECEQNRLNFELVQGQRFQQSIQLLRFNNETQLAEPVDLTGAKARFRIYHPRYEIDLSLTHEASGRSFTKTVTLTEQESSEVSSIDDLEKRQAFVSTLPTIREAMNELAVEAKLEHQSPAPNDGAGDRSS